MDEVFFALLSAVAELLCEVFFEVVLEEMVALIARSIQFFWGESNTTNPALAAVGYFMLGIAFGIASLWAYPHPLFHPSRFHGISLVISPIITGLVMSQVGTVLRRKGKQAVRIESFSYGFTFALGSAIIRLIFVR